MSASLQDGLSPEQVVAFKRTAINTITDAGTRLQMDVTAVATAVGFLHRFYTTKSLVRNDPFLVSVACLYLGGKVENSPKSVRDVLMASCELRFQAAARRLAQDRELYERLKEQVFYAERALLYALDFQFNIEQPYKPCILMLGTQPLRGARDALAARDPRWAHQVAQFAFNLINDSLRTEACLHYSGHQIAVACIWLAMKLLKVDTHVYTDEGQLWWVAQGVREEHLKGVQELLQGLYTTDVFAIYSDNNLVPQSVSLLTPQQVQQHAIAEAAERQRAAPAADGAPPSAAAGQQQAAAPQGDAGPAKQQPGEAKEEDYDDLLAGLEA